MGRKKLKLNRQCVYCSKSFYPKDDKSIYCSRECYLLGVKAPTKINICKQCGKSFIVGRDCKGLFCSNSCSAKYKGKVLHMKTVKKQLKRQQERKQKYLMCEELKKKYKELKQRYYSVQNKMNHIKYCAECGKQFIARDIQTLCCSKKCSNKRNNARRDKRIYRNGKPNLSISLTKLYMRAMGVCALCGKHINFDCDSNSNNYPSIDHIKPIAKGGLHSWDNVQLACRGCNSTKSDKF